MSRPTTWGVLSAELEADAAEFFKEKSMGLHIPRVVKKKVSGSILDKNIDKIDDFFLKLLCCSSGSVVYPDLLVAFLQPLPFFCVYVGCCNSLRLLVIHIFVLRVGLAYLFCSEIVEGPTCTDEPYNIHYEQAVVFLLLLHVSAAIAPVVPCE